jgi:O-antigen/teichoic acid export membrane protein
MAKVLKEYMNYLESIENFLNREVMTKSVIKQDILILAIGKVTQLCIMLGVVRVFTSLLPPAEVGNLILFLSVASFLGLVFINPVGMYVNRLAYVWKESNKLLSNFWQYNYYVLFTSLLAFFVGFSLHFFGLSSSMSALILAIMLMLFTFVNTWYSTIIPIINLYYFRLAFVVLTLISLSSALLFSILFVNYMERTALTWIFGQIVGLMLGTVFSIIYLKIILQERFKFSSLNIKRQAVNSIANYALPLMFSTLFLWIMIHGYKLIIEGILGAEVLAYIGIGFVLAASISGAIETLIYQILHAEFYEKISLTKSGDCAYQKLVDRALPIFFFTNISLILLSPFIVRILLDQKYHSTLVYLMAGFFIEFLRMFANLLAQYIQVNFRTKLIIIPYIVGAVMNFGLTFYIVHERHYAITLPIVMIISWMLVVLIMYSSIRRLVGLILPFGMLLKFFLYSLPLFLLIFLYGLSTNLVLSLMISCVVGLYLLGVLFFNYKKMGYL